MSDPEYDAFISYRRSDGGAVARWLRRQLVGFRPPAFLGLPSDRRLKVYLDTAYERGASNFYEQNIKPALLASRWLLVVATPAAVLRPDGADDWIAREIADFSAGPRGQNVVAIRATGEFNDPLPGDLKARFPNIEIVDLRGAGRWSFLNPVRVTKLSAEKLKIVGPLLDVASDQMPLLRQEEERRQQARLGAAFGATVATLIAVSFLSVFALKARFQAGSALESSLFSTGRMVQSIAAQLGRQGSAKGLRQRLLNEGCDLMDKLQLGADREAAIAPLVTCRIERALEYEEQDDQEPAKARFQAAIDVASQRQLKTGRVDAAIQIVEARKAMGEYRNRRKDIDGAEAEFQRLLADAKRLGAIYDKRHEFAAAEGEALGRTGDLDLVRGDHNKAADHYDAAADAVDRAIGASFSNPEPRLISWLSRLCRLAGEQREQLGDLDGALARYARAAGARGRIESTKATSAIDVEAAHAYALIFAGQTRKGDAAAAAAARTEALSAAERVLAAKDAGTNEKQTAQRIKAWIQEQAPGSKTP